jgi:hypothetical protein
VSIYDVEMEKLILQIRVKNREIIGRLKSNMYNFTEGHIYYGNKVIKIRYDLLEGQTKVKLNEEQVFDHYDNILLMKDESDYVQSATPLQTCLYNKLAYLIRNIKKLKPRVLLILPYLHERRIYLNRRHEAN